jgi:single-strand DNA-binding protein
MSLSTVAGEFGLVTDPEIKFTDNGKAWAKFRGVTKERIRDSSGNWTDGKATFIDVLCFGKEAENLAESVLKGDSVVVVGKLQQREYADSEGNNKVIYQVMADLIGPSLKWTPAKSPKILDAANGVSAIKEAFDAVSVDLAPF